jgi:hypothetical protein
MSTRAVIARVGEHEGEFSGRYVHADGYPTGMGQTLWTLLHRRVAQTINPRTIMGAAHAGLRARFFSLSKYT